MCNKSIKTSKGIILLSVFWLCAFLLILQTATSPNLDSSFGNYMLTTFKSGSTAGGILFGLIVYPIYTLTHIVACYVIFTIALVVLTAFIIDRIYLEIKNSPKKNKIQAQTLNQEENREEFEESDEEYEVSESESTTPNLDENIFIPDEEEEEVSGAKRILGLDKSVNESFKRDDYKEKLEKPYISQINDVHTETDPKRPNMYIHEEDALNTSMHNFVDPKQKAIEEKKAKDDERRKAALEYLKISKGKFDSNVQKGVIDNVSPKVEETKQLREQTNNNLNRLGNLSSRLDSLNSIREQKIGENPFKTHTTRPEQMDIYDDALTKKKFNEDFRNGITINNGIPAAAQKVYTGETKDNIVEAEGFRPVQITINDPAQKTKPTQKLYKKPPKYNKPPIELLKAYASSIDRDDPTILEKGNLIVETLRAFRIETKIINAIKGPTFTRYELQMAPGISVNTINNKINDLSMALESRCRVQVPIPGKNAFGIEVPNTKRVTVGLREMLESSNFQNSKSPLTFALGKNISGECKIACIDKMVHTLVAGSTGSGKSVCLNTMLMSLLYKASPEDLRLILVDPKMVEFSIFNNLPHMLVPKVITDCEKAVAALGWLVEEMDRRYQKLSNLGVKKISEYNETTEVISGSVEKMYYIVLVFDEVGDFMNRAKKEIEEKILLLAAKSRACGIHIILATQRPTTDVITGTIKTNLPSRIAFAVNSSIDSKVILETTGAESLLGMGDMLFLPQGSNEADRIQGCFVENSDFKKVIEYIKDNNEAVFDEEIEDQMFNKKEGFDASNGVEDSFDPMLKDCLRYFIKAKKASASSLQGYFGMGYPKANKIVLQMERAGFVSPGDNNGRRTLYITQQEFEEKFGEDLDE